MLEQERIDNQECEKIKIETIYLMRLQLKALLEIATASQMENLFRHINKDMIDDMEKLASPSDVQVQFFRICKEIREAGLAEQVNKKVQESLSNLNISLFKGE